MIKIINPARDNIFMQLTNYYNPAEIIAFDIETTGFAAETTQLYLIGVASYSNNKWIITQLFNDDGKSEKQIIECFFAMLKGSKYLFNYNGDGFDIPYITKKINQYNMDYKFDECESIDLYKHIKPFKSLLHLDNLKQKSIERYLGLNRLDKYSGGDLIKVYSDYLKNGSDIGKKLVLQHNYEDLEGLLCCSSLLSYEKFKLGCFSVKKMSVNNHKLVFHINIEYPFPKRISLGKNDIIITGYQNEVSISVPILDEELKFFFDNYKDYYYLPIEDMAVHKSVASFVDKNYRVAAKKETCYQKKYGHFITQLDGGILSGYKRNYRDKETYIELVDSFLQDISMINAYARYIVSKCI